MKEQESYDIVGIRFNEVSQNNVRLAGLEEEAAQAVTAYPNPMTSETSFAVTVPTSSTVTVRIHDVFGKVVNTIFNGDAAAGTMSLAWNGVDAAGARVAAGTYIVRVAGDNFSTTTKLTVAR
jgi:flagellar hook assembly protein FlgD